METHTLNPVPQPPLRPENNPGRNRRKTQLWVVASFGLLIAAVLGVWSLGRNSTGSSANVSLVEQLRNPWKFLKVDRSRGFSLVFDQPAVTAQRIRIFGATPSPELVENDAKVWLFDWISDSEGKKEDRFRTRLIFEHSKLKRIDLPYNVGRFVSNSAIIQYAFALGYSKIDYAQHRTVLPANVVLPFPAISFPTQEESGRLFGPPTETKRENGMTVWRYRYKQICPRGGTPLTLEATLFYRTPLGAFHHGEIRIGGATFVFTETGAYASH